MNYSNFQTLINQNPEKLQSESTQFDEIVLNWCNFESDIIPEYQTNKETISLLSDEIIENKIFRYPVFSPTNKIDESRAIILLHGLNERNWNKYYSWAYSLCQKTKRTVILFPLAFHINRSPQSWSNPRYLEKLYSIRKTILGPDRSVSYANMAISSRLWENPLRFFHSGKQTLQDIEKLIGIIQDGKHSYIGKNTGFDIFAYSIGAFLAEIALIENKNNLYSDSKLFIFCGGGTFNSMSGNSRSIIDRFAFEKLTSYYSSQFKANDTLTDPLEVSFKAMIDENNFRDIRKSFFSKNSHRISGILLKKDKVMSYSGLEQAVGYELAHSNFQYIDFGYDYSHEQPFPQNSNDQRPAIDESFELVFDVASRFFKPMTNNFMA